MAGRERPPVYADEDLDRPLTRALRDRGLDLLTTAEAGRRRAPDDQQIEHAARLGCVLLTHNGRDFRRLHNAWMAEGRSHAGIIVLPQTGPTARRALRATMLLDWLLDQGGPVGQFAVWGDLQSRLQRGLRVEGYTTRDVQVALGQAEA